MSHLFSIDSEANILYHLLEFILFLVWIPTLEIVENAQVLFRCQKIKEHIMLRTDAHELTNVTHLLKDISIIDDGFAFCLFNQSRQDGDCSRLTCSVVSKQSEYLVAIHFNIEAFHSLESSVKCFLKVLYLEIVTKLLLTFANLRWWFIIIFTNISFLKLIIFLDFNCVVSSLSFGSSLPFATAAFVCSWENTEARILTSAKLYWQCIVQI